MRNLKTWLVEELLEDEIGLAISLFLVTCLTALATIAAVSLIAFILGQLSVISY